MIAQIIYAIVLIFGFLSLLENMKLEEKNKDLKKEIYELSRKNAELATDNLKLTIEIEEMKKGAIMYEEIEFLFKGGDKIICPFCHDIIHLLGDAPITEKDNIVMCPRCGARSEIGKWQKQEQEK